MKKLLTNERGFTLIELLICLAIIAVLAAIKYRGGRMDG